jgi:hypothetical protein
MPFFERNSFVLRQLLQPGWVNNTNAAISLSYHVFNYVRYPRARQNFSAAG